MTKTPFALRLLLAGLCGLASAPLQAQNPQQLVFARLRASGNPSTNPAQFNAVKSDATGNLYLLLDQKDGIRLLKTDPSASTVLAQTQLGAHGDIGLGLALDPAGDIYVTGTTTSGSLATTPGSAFPAPADTSVNSFIAKFDSALTPLFVTYTGSGRTAAASIAATTDAVFITGSTFASTLPVTSSAIIQSPASGSFQNGFVEKFSSTGALLYATYLSGLNGDTAPSAIAADSNGNAYITGYTTSSGYPTLNALIPSILAPTSGFLTKLTPTADGLVFSTFIPGTGITSLALDPATQNLLLSGTVDPGQFPVATVSMPLVNTTYQTLLRLPLDGSTVLSSTLLAPGTQSSVTAAPSGAAWASMALSTPLIPAQTLSEIGNTAALRVTAQGTIDQAARCGGLPTKNAAFASSPLIPTSLTSDPAGQPIFAGAVTPTASSSLLATQTYDLPLYDAPTPALPSTLRNAVLAPGSCSGSLCSGSAAFLAKLDPGTSAPSLALSTDASPNITLRNLGSAQANNLQIAATGFTPTYNCATTLAPGGECSISLAGSGPGTLTVQATNAAIQTAAIPRTAASPTPIVFSPKELDFGIQTSASPSSTRTITITNLTQQSQTFTSKFAGSASAPYTIAEAASDCTLASPTTKRLAPGAACNITLGLTASNSAANDGPVATNWLIGTGDVLLTGYTQAAALTASTPHIDFGTQYTASLPRYLYLSNNSAVSTPHASLTLPAGSPFLLSDRCPTLLEPHTVCQLQIAYQSLTAPSSDSTTLSLDQGLTVLVTGKTIPQPGTNGSTTNPNLSVTPATVNFPNAVAVTSTSATTQNVTVSNTGVQPFTLALALTGDFTDTTNCPSVLNGGVICTITVAFAPSQPGTRQGLLSVSTGAGTTPAYVDLSGTATPILSGNNGTLDFGSVIVGQPSVQWYKITQPLGTVTAISSATDFTAILVEDLGHGHGQPPSGSFTATATGPCTNCWLGIQFKPSAAGPRPAAMTLTSGTSGSPYNLSLSGNGLALTGLILSPSNADFAPTPINSTTAPNLFTLTNLTPSPITLTSSTATGDFGISGAPSGGPVCATSQPLTAAASCFLQIAFSPTALGSRAGALTLQTSYGPATASLTGFGSPDPGLSLNPTSLVFKNLPGPSATQQTITLTNTGIYSLQIAPPTNTSPSFTSATTCGSLAASATCTITVFFIPSAAQANDALQIPVTSSATGNPTSTFTVPLTGAYTTEDAGLQIIPNQANSGPAPTGTLGITRQFTINNLTARSLALQIALPRQFILSGPPCSSLDPNAGCNFAVTFLPLTNGDITGTLFAQAIPNDGSPTLSGIGYVEGYGTGSAGLSISGGLFPGNLLNFNQVTSGQTSSRTLTLTNPAATPVTIRRVTSEWPFLSTTTCGATLALNQSCTITVNYTPLNQLTAGTSSPLPSANQGTLIIESDSISSPDFIDLAGNAAPVLVSSPANTAPLVSFAASQGSLTFAPTQVGNASASQAVILSNNGTATIHIGGLQTTPDFTASSDCGTLVPTASCTITIAFSPKSTGTRIGAVEITSDASAALDFISLLGTASPANLVFAPTSLDFGTILVGATARLPIQITNVSSSAATFNGITATGDYTATGTCPAPGATLAPSTSCTLQIAFTPAQPGTRAGVLSLDTSLTALPLTAALTGIGAQSHLQISPASLNFGSLAIGSSATRTLTLANTGTAPVDTIGLSVSGDYAITNPCALSSLVSGASCSVTITFTPTAAGTRNGTLTVTSNDQNSPATVPLTGTGSSSAGTALGSFTLTVDGGPSSTISVKSGKPATYNLTVTPQNGTGGNFNGAVVLNCTPVNPGLYATCSLLPSSITLNGSPQNAVATVNTITSATTGAQSSADASSATRSRDRPRSNEPPHLASALSNLNPIALCALPAAVLFVWRRKRLSAILLTLLTAAVLFSSGCGSGGTTIINNTDPTLRYTPPGTYQYQVTATSTGGIPITQSVTLNLIVTAQ